MYCDVSLAVLAFTTSCSASSFSSASVSPTNFLSSCFCSFPRSTNAVCFLLTCVDPGCRSTPTTARGILGFLDLPGLNPLDTPGTARFLKNRSIITAALIHVSMIEYMVGKLIVPTIENNTGLSGCAFLYFYLTASGSAYFVALLMTDLIFAWLVLFPCSNWTLRYVSLRVGGISRHGCPSNMYCVACSRLNAGCGRIGSHMFYIALFPSCNAFKNT